MWPHSRQLWDSVSAETIRTLSGHGAGVWVVIEVNGKLWSGSERGAIFVWDGDTARVRSMVVGSMLPCC